MMKGRKNGNIIGYKMMLLSHEHGLVLNPNKNYVTNIFSSNISYKK